MVALTTLTTLTANAQEIDWGSSNTTTTTEKKETKAITSGEEVVDGLKTFNPSSEYAQLDHQWGRAAFDRDDYSSKSFVTVGGMPDPLVLQRQKLIGLQIGLEGGGIYDQNHFSPMAGVNVSFVHMWWRVSGSFLLNTGYQPLESDQADQKFLAKRTEVGVGVKFAQWANHSASLWVEPYWSYKLNKNYKGSTNSWVEETESSIVTHYRDDHNLVKASTQGWGVRILFRYNPQWSAVGIEPYVSVGQNQVLIYNDTKWNWGATAGIRVYWNVLSIRKTNTHLVKALGLSPSDLKAARRDRNIYR